MEYPKCDICDNPLVPEEGQVTAHTTLCESCARTVRNSTTAPTPPPIPTQQGMTDEEIEALADYVFGTKEDPITDPFGPDIGGSD
jgi:hypothetical protein